MRTQTLFFTLAMACAGAVMAANEKPNILYIVADDMGYADCGAQGCRDIPTPNLDTLASGSVHFTQGYVTGAVCSPSRAALMTARHQLRDGVPDWVHPGSKHGLKAGVPTIADYLKKAGYHTMLVGKWHLGEPDECNPLNRGFDEFFGFLGGGRSYFPDRPGAKVDRYQQIVRQRQPVGLKEYTTHDFGREAAKFIEAQKGKTQPFFLYLAFNAVHCPLEAPQNYLKKFHSIQDKGRRTYAGMLSAMDDNIGKVLKAVHDSGFEENTIVMFISDNGGPITRNAPNNSRNTPLRGGKGETWEGGIRVPFFLKWPGHFKAGATFTEPAIQMDVTATMLAIAGAQVNPKYPIDGVDLRPYLNGEKKGMPHETMCWEYGPQYAIRQGNWKLTYAFGAKGAKKPTMGLFDLSKDIGEHKNLAAAHADMVKKLQADWSSWRKSVGGKTPEISMKDVAYSP